MENPDSDNSKAEQPNWIPPQQFQQMLGEAELKLREGQGSRWNDQQTTQVFLSVWARVIDDIGNYRPYGSDDYQHHLSYRVALHHLMIHLLEMGHLEALNWLRHQVDFLDSLFRQRSDEDSENLILRPDRHDPALWFLRRLPRDENVVAHLRMLLPKKQ